VISKDLNAERSSNCRLPTTQSTHHSDTRSMQDRAFLGIKNKLFSIANGGDADLRSVLWEFAEMLMGSVVASVERSDCFIALCRLFKNESHRRTVLEWIRDLILGVRRESPVFSELVFEFFVPLLTPPLICHNTNPAAACDVLQLLTNPLTASAVVAAYCDLYPSASVVKRRLKLDVEKLNEYRLFEVIDLDEATLDSEIAFWLS